MSASEQLFNQLQKNDPFPMEEYGTITYFYKGIKISKYPDETYKVWDITDSHEKYQLQSERQVGEFLRKHFNYKP